MNILPTNDDYFKERGLGKQKCKLIHHKIESSHSYQKSRGPLRPALLTLAFV